MGERVSASRQSSVDSYRKKSRPDTDGGQHQPTQGSAAHDTSTSIESGGRPGHHIRDIPLTSPSPSGTRSASSRTAIQQIAQQTHQLPSTLLPYAAQIQRSFGHHRLNHVEAHQGSEAAESAQALDALAFTHGNQVVFASPPNLQTAAHEAAHVIQQRRGVHLPGGIDTPGDPYEQQARAVAQRVMAGHSAETLLDQMPTHTTSTSSALNGVPAQGTVIQRVTRAGLDNVDTTKLTPAEVEEQKKVFTQDKGEAGPPVTAEDAQATKLFAGLENAAQGYITAYNNERGTNTSTTHPAPRKKAKGSGASDYNAILALAMRKVKAMYGLQLTEAYSETASDTQRFSSFLSAAENGGQAITLSNPDDRFSNAKPDTERIKSEAIGAAKYMIDYPDITGHEEVKRVFSEIVAYHKTKDNTITKNGVEGAYLEYLENHGTTPLFEKLAEAVLRYDPKTENNVIYFASRSQKIAVEHAWATLKVLVHEVMHTAAHKKFNEYASNQGVFSNDILEGTVDYFALKVWQQIAADVLKASPDKQILQTVQAITKVQNPGDLGSTAKKYLQNEKNTPLYGDAVADIKEAMAKISDGERRLKAAFFYGDVEHFFPGLDT